jgi:hypothetical protein
MSSIAAVQRKAIEHIVCPDRARFDKRERRIYLHDPSVHQGPTPAIAGKHRGHARRSTFGRSQPPPPQRCLQPCRASVRQEVLAWIHGWGSCSRSRPYPLF